ncbi:GNAT family N-acetyltransferase [Methylibium rhizosphaerae]|uniref:GNAT family N-acetyltransferase n=1 Tax=Methylibium rhizosphaerae TaxID=2570323 RepID=UPI00112EDFD4|nr:GNAT family N-acetyltransferase [Methylibium rhizosphaerae]
MLATPSARTAAAALQPMPGMAALAVRPAIAADVAAVTRIYNESLPPLPTQPDDPQARLGGRLLAISRLLPLPDEGLCGWMAAHRSSGRPLWVAHAGGEPVGWLSLLGFGDRPACTYAAEVAIYIARAWQGRGVGRTLLGHALREAPRWHIDRLMAFIWHDNAASVGLFRAHGFSPWGSLPGAVWADARSRDMLIFGRVLDASGSAPA